MKHHINILQNADRTRLTKRGENIAELQAMTLYTLSMLLGALLITKHPYVAIASWVAVVFFLFVAYRITRS